MRRLSNETRFILAVVSGELTVSNRRKADIVAQLEAAGYDAMPPSKKARRCCASETPVLSGVTGNMRMMKGQLALWKHVGACTVYCSYQHGASILPDMMTPAVSIPVKTCPRTLLMFCHRLRVLCWRDMTSGAPSPA